MHKIVKLQLLLIVLTLLLISCSMDTTETSVKLITFTSTDENSVTLSWSGTDLYADYLIIERSEDTDFTSVAYLAGETTSWLDTDVESGLTFTYRIKINIDGSESVSSEFSYTHPLTDDDYTVDTTKWTIAWSDEFNNNTFDTDTWARQIWLTPPNNEWEQYTGEEDTAYEEDGYMILKADLKDGMESGYGNYTSARVISNPGGSDGDSGSTGKTFEYGKIAARIQLPSGKGVWPAFWMLGDNIYETGGDTSWPSCGEIDILETGFSGNEDGEWGGATLGGAIHYDTSIDNDTGSWTYETDHTSLDEGRYSDDFHVYEIEWDESSITWRVDEEEFFTTDITDSMYNEFREEFYILFNIAIGGNLTDDPDGTDYPKYMKIDWIRHYTKN